MLDLVPRRVSRFRYFRRHAGQITATPHVNIDFYLEIN